MTTPPTDPANADFRGLEEIHAAALEQGMIDLKRYAALLLIEGLTTVEEVTSVVSMEV